MPQGTRELRLVVTAPDYDMALRFYRDAVGLREEASFVDDNGGRATLLHAGRATIELADELHAEAIDALEVGRRVAGPVRIAFEVDDAAAAAGRLSAAGAVVVAPPMVTPWGSMNARLDGPDGQHLTVWSNDAVVSQRPRFDGQIELVEPDRSWAGIAADLVAGIRASLGPAAVVVAHVGSTSVPALAAKPIIDLVLGVPDPVDESAYVAALEGQGYRLAIREPEWHEHRLLKRPDPAVNLHVFAAGSDEIERMLAFRDQLRRDVTDRQLYAATKRELAEQRWDSVQDYADAKSDVVEAILRRAVARGPAPLRGSFILVTGPSASGAVDIARQLAPPLGLPLLATESLLAALHAAGATSSIPAGSPDAGSVVLLALAAESGGAILALPEVEALSTRVAAMPGRVIEVACAVGDGVRAAGGWPVVEAQGHEGPDIDRLVRCLRQMAASD
jgi:GrpB-like predicted nucleotidyltransferase (UPF0157 family)/predicted enzyme related to lactoylglutathione lyase